MTIEQVAIPVEQAGEMSMYVARPMAYRAPGIMVFQEAFGLTAHIRDIANRLAEFGFLAVAPELFHRTAEPGFQGSYDDFASVTPHIKEVTPERLEADIRATHNWLSTDPQVDSDAIGAIGFCMGGRAAYIANSILPLRAAVSYYAGGLTGPMLERSARQSAPILFFWGGRDKNITPTIRDTVIQSMRDSGKPYASVEISYADHGFLCHERAAYSPEAAAEAWAMTTAFLNQKMHAPA